MVALTIKADPIDKDVDLLFSETLSPAARSRLLALAAKDELKDAEETNRNVLGRVPPHKTFVDGSEGLPEERVKPDGAIVYEFQLDAEVLQYISDMLRKYSPVGAAGDRHPGLYKKSHAIFADHVEVPPGAVIPPAQTYTFVNLLPYARKIETGESPMAPEGVYEVVAAMARSRFSKIARIVFTYQAAIAAGSKRQTRNPAIVVTFR